MLWRKGERGGGEGEGWFRGVRLKGKGERRGRQMGGGGGGGWMREPLGGGG